MKPTEEKTRSNPSDLPVYLFKQGNNCEAYRYFGAHIEQRAGETGVVFRVWAPHATAISVVGDFNSWKPGSHPMRKVDNDSVWELFIPVLNLRSQRFTIGGGTGENIYSVNDTGESVALGSMSAIDSSGKSSALSGNVYVITSNGTSQLEQRTTTSSGSGSFVISGSGYGHNVGMSQWGAYSMANLGYSYRDILQFYYTDVSIR